MSKLTRGGDLLIASAYYPPYAPGGAEYSLVEMCKRLGPSGWRIVVITPCYDGQPRRVQGDGCEIVLFPSPLRGRAGQEFDAARYLQSRAFERAMTSEIVESARGHAAGRAVLLANNFQCYVPVARAGRLTGVRTAGIVRDSQSICETGSCIDNCRADDAKPCRGLRGAVRCTLEFARNRNGTLGRAVAGVAWQGLRNGLRRERLLRRGLNALDAVVTISQALEQLLRRGRRVAAQSLTVIPNFRADIAPSDPGEVDAFLEAQGLKRKGFFLMAGKKSYGKGADIAAAALGQIRQIRPEARLLFVGKGQVPRAAEYGCVDHEPVSQEMVLGLLQASTGLLIPGRWQEGLHRTLIEALFHGLPVVCSEAGAPPESVRDGLNGYVVACNDPVALGQALLKVLAWDAPARARAAAAARRIFEEKFSDAVVSEKWRLFLEAVPA